MIEEHPDRYGRVTTDSARSAPVLSGAEGRPSLSVFWFPAGGARDARVAYPPYVGATIAMDRPEDVVFSPVELRAIGGNHAVEVPLGSARLEGITTNEQFDEIEASLYSSLDRLAARFRHPPSRLDDDRAAARTYLSAVERLVPRALRNVHRAYSPQFFAWLDDVVRR